MCIRDRLNASYETYQFRQVGGYAHGTFKDVSPEQAERIACLLYTSNLPADADNPSAPGNTAFHPPGTEGYKDALA